MPDIEKFNRDYMLAMTSTGLLFSAIFMLLVSHFTTYSICRKYGIDYSIIPLNRSRPDLKSIFAREDLPAGSRAELKRGTYLTAYPALGLLIASIVVTVIARSR